MKALKTIETKSYDLVIEREDLKRFYYEINKVKADKSIANMTFKYDYSDGFVREDSKLIEFKLKLVYYDLNVLIMEIGNDSFKINLEKTDDLDSFVSSVRNSFEDNENLKDFINKHYTQFGNKIRIEIDDNNLAKYVDK